MVCCVWRSVNRRPEASVKPLRLMAIVEECGYQTIPFSPCRLLNTNLILSTTYSCRRLSGAQWQCLRDYTPVTLGLMHACHTYTVYLTTFLFVLVSRSPVAAVVLDCWSDRRRYVVSENSVVRCPCQICVRLLLLVLFKQQIMIFFPKYSSVGWMSKLFHGKLFATVGKLKVEVHGSWGGGKKRIKEKRKLSVKIRQTKSSPVLFR